MKYSFGFAVSLMIFFNVFPGFGQKESCTDQNSSHPMYRTIEQRLDQETVTREYILYVPANYDHNIATPLVIIYHGFGECASGYSETIGSYYGLDVLADSENFIVAYPQGAFREKGAQYWEPGDNGEQDIRVNDVYFSEQLISDISSTFNINLSRVYAAGYSNGGMMAYSLACSRGDLFAAIGIMSGTMLDESCNINQNTPIIIFHGIGDDILPYEGNQNYQSVSEVVNFWLNHNNIPSASLVTTELNGGTVVRDEYSGGNDNTCLTLYSVYEEYGKAGGHVWFSDEINGSSPNQILWDFLSSGCDSTTTVIDTISAIDKINRFKMFRNYPNPYNPQTTITFIMPHSEHIELKVYDVNGKVVQTLVNDTKNRGMHSVHWNAENVSSGVYFYKIVAGEFVMMHKMMLVK